MKKTQKKSVYVIQISLDLHKLNFDFLVLYKMYFQNYLAHTSIELESFTSHLQHSRPCCIRNITLVFGSSVYPIQHGRSCCK